LVNSVLFTIAALLVFRLGTFIPIPGQNPIAVGEIFNLPPTGITSTLNMLGGGAVARMSIFALGLIPYLSALIIMDVISPIAPKLTALKNGELSGQKQINQYARCLTIGLTAVQAYGIAISLESSGDLVLAPGAAFQATTVITLVTGSMLLMWLGDQITQRGVSNGPSLIILAGMLSNVPSAVGQWFDAARASEASSGLVLLSLALMFVVAAAIVFFERAQRRVLVQYPRRVRQATITNDCSDLALKLNPAGIIPPILALMFFGTSDHNMLYAALISIFAYVVAGMVVDAKATANNLEQNGGFIPGIRPGAKTTEYIEHVVARIAIVGAIYLAIVCVSLPVMSSYMDIPLRFTGTAFVIITIGMLNLIADLGRLNSENQT
jgi:preprotein translocase subunit SecY